MRTDQADTAHHQADYQKEDEDTMAEHAAAPASPISPVPHVASSALA